ncbi:MAG: PKD domain-containing protein [Candidatus Bipolaricaulis sp.]|nr:PKD domain-containing protein [Candidatus Bipolaricaulis sp.]
MAVPQVMARRGRMRAFGALWVLLASVLVASGGPAVAAEQPQVVQPDSAQYTSAQQGRLRIEIQDLEQTLADPSLGSRMTLGERGWTSVQFAIFSAGALAGLGYKTAAVSARWSGGEHVWVMVEVNLGVKTAWIPVEAAPSGGSLQVSLGRIPWDSGQGRYEERYVTFDRTMELPPNQPPIAAVRFPVASSAGDGTVSFTAMMSRDPDGEIILYVWSVDGAPPVMMTKTWTYEHVFVDAGDHTVTVTVVDDRGARATATATLAIHPADSPGGARVGSGCGCGG